MALVRQIVACLALAAAAFAFSACGEESPQGPKIPADFAQGLVDKLDTVKERAAEGRCVGDNSAESALEAVQDGVDGLPGDTDQEIIDNLRELIGDLDSQITQSCDDEAAATETETSTTTTTEETPTDETKSTTEDPATEEPDTTPPDDTDTEPVEPETPPADPPDDGPEGTGPPDQSGNQGGFDTEGGGIAPRGVAAAGGGAR